MLVTDITSVGSVVTETCNTHLNDLAMDSSPKDVCSRGYGLGSGGLITLIVLLELKTS